MRNNGWNFPLWSPEGEGAGAEQVDTAWTEAGKTVASDVAADDVVATDKDEAKAARQAELDAMSPEDRAKAEADEAASDVEDAKLDMIPEDGVYDLKMPDGVNLDAEMLAALGPEFKELGLSNRDAQRLADKFIAAQTARMTKQAEDWAATTQGWVDEARRDPEIGGAKWDASAAAAAGVVDRFGSPGLREYLNASGAGNHPELIRLLAKVGAAIGEDNPALSESPGGGGKQDAASTLYPNDPPKGK